jgi:hypothetical protein
LVKQKELDDYKSNAAPRTTLDTLGAVGQSAYLQFGNACRLTITGKMSTKVLSFDEIRAAKSMMPGGERRHEKMLPKSKSWRHEKMLPLFAGC